MENCPIKITGDLDCSVNLLISLKGCPITIGGINCDHNELINLKYSPEEVHGNFSCSANKLKSLIYSPKIINGGFFCNKNELVSLQYLPEYIKEDLDCSDNKLTTFEFFPCIVDSLNISGNPIEKKELANFNIQVLNYFWCSGLGYNSNEEFFNAVNIEKINKEKKELDLNLAVGHLSTLNKKRL